MLWFWAILEFFDFLEPNFQGMIFGKIDTKSTSIMFNYLSKWIKHDAKINDSNIFKDLAVFIWNLFQSCWKWMKSSVWVLLCDSLCSAGKTFIVMEDTETPSFQCKMCQTNASSFHHKVEIISCVLVVLSRLSLQSSSSWQNVSLFSQQKKPQWRIPK